MLIEENAIYTPAEVAELLRCGKSNVYDLIGSGVLAVTRIGAGKKGFRIRGLDIYAFLDSRKTGGPKPRMAIRNPKLRPSA